MRITATGNVGIGTSTPGSKLEVMSPSYFGLRVSTGLPGGTVASFASNGNFEIDSPFNPGGRLKVVENGDVGIGLGLGISPSSKLHVAGTGIIRASVDSDSNAGLGLRLGGQPKWSVATFSPGDFQIYNDAIGQNAMIINRSTNNVAFGTTPTAAKLFVNTSGAFGLIVSAAATGGNVAEFGGNGAFVINSSSNGSTIVGGRLTVDEDGTVRINNTGTQDPLTKLIVNGAIIAGFPVASPPIGMCHDSIGRIGECISSIRYKRNVNDYLPGLNLVSRLRPVSFNWKQGGEPDMGLIAEEVANAEPLLVTHDSHGEILGVKYDRIAVVLLNAVKEQQAQITEQAELIKQQQAQLVGLKRLVCKTHQHAKACN